MKKEENFSHNISQYPQAPLLCLSDEKLSKILEQHKLTEDEYCEILNILGRNPTFAELGVFSSMWSEHCSYKSSRVHLRRLPTTGERVVVGPGENAGIVRLKDDVCIAFKMESHNHPSFIEPYQGAATGVGGILRDVFCMGARPIANLNCLRFGSKEHKKTPWLFHEVVKGIGDYGNCVGIPTVGGNVAFHERYNENILVNAMTVGIIKEDEIFKGNASGIGNLVFYVGSSTGRDGIHGATMASDSFDQDTEDKDRGAVQVGDPFCEKLLLEATLEVLKQGLVVGIQDMGAAGLTSSIFEMASRAGTGVRLELDQVPTRAQKMTPYELLLSESQERMLMVVEPQNKDEIESIFAKWELAYSVIGQITDSKRVQAIHSHAVHLDVPVDELSHRAPMYKRPMKPRMLPVADNQVDDVNTLCVHYVKETGKEKICKKLLEECADKQAIYQQYDHHIGLKTVLGPESGGGVVLWLDQAFFEKETFQGLAIATACCENYCEIDPKEGAAHSVMKAARMIAATGAKPLAITDCLNYGNPDDPEIMWQFSEGVDGITEACNQLKIPVVSGNVSFYNQTNERSILPTPMIGMVGEIDDVRKCIPAVTNEYGCLYLLAPKTQQPSFAGSLIADMIGCEQQRSLLAIDYPAEKEAFALLQLLANKKYLHAAREVGRGGVFCCTMQILSKKQGQVGLITPDQQDNESFLFGERPGAYVLVVDSSCEENFLQEIQVDSKITLSKIGTMTKGEPRLIINQEHFNINGLNSSLDHALRFL